LNFNNDTGVSNAFTSKMSLTNAGQLGIGTSTPSESLHAIGNIKGTGNLILEGGHHITTAATVLNSGAGQFNWRRIVGSNTAPYTDLMILADSNLSLCGSATVSTVNINSVNGIDFGYSIAGRDITAGKIGYSLFTSNTLDIVGAGTGPNVKNIKLWDNVTIPQNLTIGGTIINTQFSTISSLATSANTLSLNTSNYVYPQIATLNSSLNNNNLCKINKSVNSTATLYSTIKWANNLSTGNHFFIILSIDQNFSSDTLFGIRNTQLCISLSNASISDQKSASVWGSPSVFTTMSCVVSSSSPTTNTLTLASSTSWTPTGNICHQFGVSLISFPTDCGAITVS
jgi:hypothetical protein